jgi:mannose-6-phosphate isomerase-like protein (cupin superfamily)
MQQRRLIVLSTLLVGAAVAGLTSVGVPGAPVEASTNAPQQAGTVTAASWEAFSYGDLVRRRADAERPYLPFLEAPTLSTGLYVLAAGGDDRQQPHTRDEVYYIVSGRATIEVDGDSRPVSAGDVIYVKAQIDHRFVDIEEELQVIVFFAGGAAGD